MQPPAASLFYLLDGSPPKSTVRRWTSQSLRDFQYIITDAHPQTRSWYLKCDVLQKDLPCNHSVRKSRLIRDQAVNGESRPKGIVMCRGCLFFRPGYTNSLRFVF